MSAVGLGGGRRAVVFVLVVEEVALNELYGDISQ